MRKQLCLSKPYSFKVGKDAADRQKRRQENKFKEMKSQIFVSLVGLMQTYGDNMEKGESFKGELKRHCEAAMQILYYLTLQAWVKSQQEAMGIGTAKGTNGLLSPEGGGRWGEDKLCFSLTPNQAQREGTTETLP